MAFRLSKIDTEQPPPAGDGAGKSTRRTVLKMVSTRGQNRQIRKMCEG
jgi:16S rRNA U516 pseudouridylate synthase RsuA-like enzyme